MSPLAGAALLLAGAASAQTFRDYRVLYDPASDGRRATWATIVPHSSRWELVFTDFVEDDEAGALPYLVRSRRGGKSWSAPEPFAMEILRKLGNPKEASSALSTFGPTRRGTVLAVGYHVAKGARKESYKEDIRYRGGSLVVGRKEKGARDFAWQAYPTGTFLGEQFGYGGIIHSSGRTILQIWGAARGGENWQCGVLLSDDDGRTFRYRTVGYEPSLEIRDDPRTPAGFNEQTLLEMTGGTLVSLIRGREKLGRVPDSRRDTWYFRSESRDRGETWSKPEPTNLAGTGAPPSGIALPDGSLLTASRVPYSRTLYPLGDKTAFGLHFARSIDGGRTWTTTRLFQADPEGRPFDNHYNAMNGQFLRLGRGRWLYLFPHFAVKSKIHRVLSVTIDAR